VVLDDECEEDISDSQDDDIEKHFPTPRMSFCKQSNFSKIKIPSPYVAYENNDTDEFNNTELSFM
jgi:hypothetical protein